MRAKAESIVIARPTLSGGGSTVVVADGAQERRPYLRAALRSLIATDEAMIANQSINVAGEDLRTWLWEN